ncbi:hypothetical protein [Brevibacterium luteolum]|uniref:Uncharacterized protein n=1 Tax=Brevibacterium luteolum TaxID=199591 RepID=A0A2N6PG87_9MICO|nr:hypothetical protein [Brevibacterium luteolum]PMB97696.1 hypothetical protein CJ198_09845 [Brevibacterium luteolum]
MGGHTGYVWPVAKPIVDKAVGKTIEVGKAGREWAEDQVEEHIIEPHLVPALEGLLADVEQSQAAWMRVAEECARAEAVCRQSGSVGWVSSAAEVFRERIDEHAREVGSLATEAQAVVEAYDHYLAELRSSPIGQALGL